MNRRTYTLVLMWLLPLLLARALIPSGFMLGAGAEGFGLIFCSGTMSMSMSMDGGGRHVQSAGHVDHSMHMAHAASAASMDHAEHPGHADRGNPHSANESAACPFAIGACVASIDIPHLAVGMAAPVDEAFRPVTLVGSGSFALRAHPIRGPPSLS